MDKIRSRLKLALLLSLLCVVASVEATLLGLFQPTLW